MQPALMVVGSSRMRLSQVPTGDVLDIENTSELLKGDRIYVEFPFPSKGWAKYGSSETFTVFAFDTGANKVGVTDDGGGQAWFGGGTKADLLAKLAEKTSFSKLVIFRPRPRPAPPPPLTPSDAALFARAKELGLPAGYAPLAPRLESFGGLLPGDYFVSVPSPNLPHRLWVVLTPPDPRGVVMMVVVATTKPGERGAVDFNPHGLRVERWQMAFRGAAGAPPAELPDTRGSGSPLVYIGVGVGVLAIAVGIWALS